MTTLPQIQKRLHSIADEVIHPLLFPRTMEDISREMHHLTNQISRRKPVRRAPRKSRTTTPQLKREMRAYSLLHPDETEQQISERFGVIAGRVSEALNGKRT